MKYSNKEPTDGRTSYLKMWFVFLLLAGKKLTTFLQFHECIIDT